MNKLIIHLVFGLLVLTSCRMNSESTLEFDPANDIYDSCINVESLFAYLEENDEGLYIDYDKLPENRICESGLTFLIDVFDSNLPCGAIKDILVAESLVSPPKSTVRIESRRLLVWFLYHEKNSDMSDDEIISEAKSLLSDSR